MPISGPAIALASSGIALPMAPTTCSATGSTRTRHTSVVCSIHSARLQAAVVVTPEGSTVASSSQWSARRMASATRPWSWRSGLGSGSCAAVRRAMSVARVQFTGPSYGAIIACIWPIRPGEVGHPACHPGPASDPPRALKICSKGVPLNGLSSGPPGRCSWAQITRRRQCPGPAPCVVRSGDDLTIDSRPAGRGQAARPPRDRARSDRGARSGGRSRGRRREPVRRRGAQPRRRRAGRPPRLHRPPDGAGPAARGGRGRGERVRGDRARGRAPHRSPGDR